MIEGISHITLIVSNLDRMAMFLTHIFDAEEVYDSYGSQFSLSREKFFMIGNVWIAIMEGEPLRERSYNHIAFKISEETFDEYANRVRGLGVEIRDGRTRVPGEGRSLYFYDDDGHLFELHTGTLNERLKNYRADTLSNETMQRHLTRAREIRSGLENCIVTITLNDIHRIAPLWEKLNEFHKKLDRLCNLPERKTIWEDMYAELKYKASRSGYIQIVVEDSADVGYCFSSIDSRKTGEIDSLYIISECRKKGYGRQLMENAIAWMEGSGCSEILLLVHPGNTKAVSFYWQYGFITGQMMKRISTLPMSKGKTKSGIPV